MKKNFYFVLALIALIIITGLAVNSLVRKRPAPSKDTSTPSLSAVYNNAKELESKKAYLEARAIYEDLLSKAKDEELIKKAQKDLMDLNMKILFSPVMTEDSIIYKVEKGDTLSRIAKRFNTTVELIMKSNNLRGDLIRIGRELKLSKAKYSVLVDCSGNTLALNSDGSVLKTYTVSTGLDNSTPRGTFNIVIKEPNPTWYKAGAIVPPGSPENVLGSRWMGISIKGYGIHGTNEPESIGKYITAGCIRMLEPDVQELYSILPIGTEVTVID